MDTAVMIFQFFLSLSILVVLHEFGHFLPARWFKTRVEKFYLFFDPWFSLVKKKVGDTEYGVGWLPLGGYVKISGMIDESMDTEQMKLPAQPWEFRSKPAWQRLIIMLGGVTVNFILGFFIFGMILWHWGDFYLPNSEAKYGIYVDDVGKSLGLQDGDKIVSIEGEAFEKFESRNLTKQIVLNGARKIEVERGGRPHTVTVPEDVVSTLSSHKTKDSFIFMARQPTVVKEVIGGTPAEKVGIKSGDQFLAVNGAKAEYFHEMSTAFNGERGVPINLEILRGRDTLSFDLVTAETGETRIGVRWAPTDEVFKLERKTYPLHKAMPMGVTKGYNFLADQIKAFGKMFSGEIKASESLGGFGTISGLFPKVWDWERFWNITAILSLILGFMNLLPIPALDGGHVMFLLWEVVTGRKPSDKFMEYSTIAGFAIIMALLIYANGLDVMRWFNK